ncbi:ATP-binding protein [Ornithinimicrobium cavernae]|uniref:ATP-binding protein n=1 Tax=Ornithinimicrobium cavernae TaxID=2666047 RepID=UPI000D68DCBD|nr:ATP-binding protein [Ornithinimicrobium cavernae]
MAQDAPSAATGAGAGQPGANPFRPGFGVSPRVLAGRDELLEEFDTALDEGPGSPLRSVLVSGARGMGKTVILNELEEAARVRGWLVVRLPESGDLVEELASTTLPALLAEHDSERAVRRRVTGAGIAGVGSLSTTARERYEVRETAATLLARLLDVLAGHGTGLLFTLDELQAVDREAVSAFASLYQHLVRDERDVALAAAGLPVGVGQLLQHRGTTFLRRAERVQLGPLRTEEVTDAARRTVEGAGGVIAEDALDVLADVVHGYPYLLQLAGYRAWRDAAGGPITADHVRATRGVVSERMGRLVHGPALLDLPQAQRAYLMAMAQDDGASSTGEVAARLGLTAQHANVFRTRLIERELIAPAGHGRVDYSLPYLRDHLRRQAATG